MGDTIIKDGKIQTIRRSDVERLRECPKAFELGALKRIPTIANVYAEHGILLHDLADAYVKGEKTYEDMLCEFETKFLDLPLKHYEGYDSNALKRALFDKGIVCINNFIEYHKNALPVHSTEETLEVNLGENYPKVSITYDRANYLGDGYELVDYKMGKVFSGVKLYKDFQLPLYAVAWEQKYGELPKRFSFIFLSENKERVYEYIGNREYRCIVRKREYIVNVDSLIAEVKNVLKDINDREFPKGENLPLHICKRCYFKDKHCKSLASWLEVK